MKARSRFSNGQILALFTIVLPVLLGGMALGADFAIIYLNWAMVQKAADAAALAGALATYGSAGVGPERDACRSELCERLRLPERHQRS